MTKLLVVNETNTLEILDQKPIFGKGADDSDINQLIHCCICFDVFEEPKTLSCLHRFCEKCVHGYILSSQEQTSDVFKERGFSCPVCRDFMKAPDPNKPATMWASMLKTDFHLKSLILLVQSKKIPSFSKSEYYENSCSKHHIVRKRTVYCAECCSVMCPMCANIFHNGCSMVIPLEEAAADQRARAAIWLREISPKLEQAAKLERLREKRQETLNQQKAAIRRSIRSRADDIRQMIQEQEDTLLEKLDQEVDVQQSKIALEAIMFNDKLISYKEKFKSVSEKLQINSDLELMDNRSRTDNNEELHGELDLANYERFVNSLSAVCIIFHQAKQSSVSVGEIAVTVNCKG